MESFDLVTSQGLSIASLFWLELAISGLLLAGVVGLLVTALIRFRAPPGDRADARQVEGNRRLEIIWTATPAATLAIIFLLVIGTMRTVNAAQPNPEPVLVTGHQWWWQFSYPNQHAVTANEMHVPVGTPLQVSLESVDVIHSFHVTQFGWMQDLVPGKTNSMWITVVRPGTFDGACNQYCGLQHAWMRVTIVADPPEQFNAWVQQQAQSVTPTNSAGEQVFLKNTCVACHAIRGLPGVTGTVGPDLTHLGSRSTLGAGVIDNTPDNLQAWIRDAQSIKPGVLMPAFPSVSPSDLSALVAYLESLK
ncbi:MAG: cytochrome c oxidase subunit II [Chloroflexi bacterium]|nr:cytochrome c oxidase subunit II [Chloroflexota bacterium]